MLINKQALAKVWDAYDIIEHTSDNMCALTFDDGPSYLTAELLDALKEENIPATFMVLGQQAKRYPKLIKRMLKEGHEVASHGYAHDNLRLISPEAVYRDIQKTHDVLQELGVTPKFLRPPYGSYTKHVVSIAKQFGMSILLWSVDSRDWQHRPDYGDMPNILERPMSADEMRGIFLFHDTKIRTVRDIKLIITVLRAVGCNRFVTVSEYLSPPNDTPKKLLAEQQKLANTLTSIKLKPVNIGPSLNANNNQQALSFKQSHDEFSFFQPEFNK